MNGSILAGRNFLGRESMDVGSALVFGDSVAVTRRVMGILDVCYPFAHKAGLLVDEAVGLAGTSPKSGCVVLLLPGALGTAVNFCGVRPVGPELQVFLDRIRTPRRPEGVESLFAPLLKPSAKYFSVCQASPLLVWLTQPSDFSSHLSCNVTIPKFSGHQHSQAVWFWHLVVRPGLMLIFAAASSGACKTWPTDLQ